MTRFSEDTGPEARTSRQALSSPACDVATRSNQAISVPARTRSKNALDKPRCSPRASRPPAAIATNAKTIRRRNCGILERSCYPLSEKFAHANGKLRQQRGFEPVCRVNREHER